MRDYVMERRRTGKHEIMVGGIRVALAMGKTVVIATPDQAASIARFKDDFPGALFSLVGDFGLKIHRRTKVRETSQG